ncbi:hypothetical protein BX070DRAFT_37123 [Coemansia spiralis]|nr:hypothetical protein BX070DRAFT_37123 [Coemansia spiralis]
MKPVNSFGAFIKTLATNTARLNNLANPANSLTLVLGNESADLDSLVSSLTLAYVLSAKPDPPGHVVPIMNTNRSDMILRQDCDLLLRTTLNAEGGRMEDLTFLDDIDLNMLVQKYKDGLNVWLVDHNAPASRQMVLEPFVRGVVDHHLDEGKCPDAMKEIEVVGSCTSLVAAKVKELGNPIDSPLAKMLLSPILMDTVNISSKAQKATDKDTECVSWLVPLVEWEDPPATASTANDDEDDAPVFVDLSTALQVRSTEELYRTLDKLKGSVSHLATRDLLRKDYKQWKVADKKGKEWVVGISSIAYRMKKWVKRDGLTAIETAISDWVSEQNLDVALVMTHGKVRPRKSAPKEYGRDLTVAFKEPPQALFIAGLVASSALNLEFMTVNNLHSDIDRSPIYLFDQKKTTASRKQVFPVVKSVIESL